MKRGFIIALVLGIVIVIIVAVVIGIVLLNKPSVSDESNQCTELGCSSDALYVGSINSDKYYECSCRWAKNINPENIICFSSDQEAEDKAYIKSEC